MTRLDDRCFALHCIPACARVAFVSGTTCHYASLPQWQSQAAPRSALPAITIVIAIASGFAATLATLAATTGTTITIAITIARCLLC